MRIINVNILIPALLLILLTLVSCRNKGADQDAVARVYDSYLYLSDLKGVVPQGVSSKDSAEITRNYIQNWIQKKIMVHQAEKNLSDDQKDFSEDLENYRNSLAIYAYESMLVNQKIDTNVSIKEIEEYYAQNQENFLLKNNIVKVLYVKIAKSSKSKVQIKKLIFGGANSEAERTKLESLCASGAVNFYLDDAKWLQFDDLLKEIPIEAYNQELYLKNNRKIEISDEEYTYLLNIRELKIRDEVSPLSFEKTNIRDIIINKRKVDLINKMREDVFKEAENNKDFEILR
jgi:hypothetical protein